MRLNSQISSLESPGNFQIDNQFYSVNCKLEANICDSNQIYIHIDDEEYIR